MTYTAMLLSLAIPFIGRYLINGGQFPLFDELESHIFLCTYTLVVCVSICTVHIAKTIKNKGY